MLDQDQDRGCRCCPVQAARGEGEQRETAKEDQEVVVRWGVGMKRSVDGLVMLKQCRADGDGVGRLEGVVKKGGMLTTKESVEKEEKRKVQGRWKVEGGREGARKGRE